MKILLDTLQEYGIAVLSVAGTRVMLENSFEVEVENTGLYNLFDEGFIVAPFTDINSLCRFIIS